MSYANNKVASKCRFVSSQQIFGMNRNDVMRGNFVRALAIGPMALFFFTDVLGNLCCQSCDDFCPVYVISPTRNDMVNDFVTKVRKFRLVGVSETDS